MRKVYVMLLGAFLLSGCARETSPDVYDDKNFGEATTTYLGIVKRAREVEVTNGEGLQNNTTGVVGGALAGALLGSTIGHGSGSVVAEVAGGIGGALGGSALEQNLKSQKATEYLVELDDGRLKTVVQSPEPRLYEGQRVCLMEAKDGRSRILAYKLS